MNENKKYLCKICGLYICDFMSKTYNLGLKTSKIQNIVFPLFQKIKKDTQTHICRYKEYF